jgi:Asp-tRNA(Asn)/Glu-tRNA(Gln) amidotransferase C subunit
MADNKKEKTGEVISDKEETVAGKSPETTTSKGEYREANMEYMKGMYPDSEINDDNYSDMIERTMSEKLIPTAKKYHEGNEKLKALMHSEGKLAMILGDMGKGAKFEEVLPKYVDVRNLELKPGDPDYTVWEANNKHREDTYKQAMSREEEIRNNTNETMRIMSDWFKEQNMDEGMQKEYGDFVTKFLDEAYAGKMSKDFHNAMKRLMNYDSDMKKETEAAEIKGRNAKIVEEKMAEKEKKAGDGYPVIEGGQSKQKETKKVEDNALVKGLKGRQNRKSVIPGNY